MPKKEVAKLERVRVLFCMMHMIFAPTLSMDGGSVLHAAHRHLSTPLNDCIVLPEPF